jgi:hypothetical protein
MSHSLQENHDPGLAFEALIMDSISGMFSFKMVGSDTQSSQEGVQFASQNLHQGDHKTLILTQPDADKFILVESSQLVCKPVVLSNT